MNSITDPWVAHYERLMEILKKVGISTDLSPRAQKKILVWNERKITSKEFREALSLFIIVFEGEV